MASPLLSELRFGSFLVYSPKGTSEISIRSRRIRDAMKHGDRRFLRDFAERLRRDFGETDLGYVLGEDVTLIPTPRSAVLIEGALWPARLLATELVRVGLGRGVIPAIQRIAAVPKSAYQAKGERPTALKHYETITAEVDLTAGERITIVDDFVTKGSTLLGAASRLAEAYPRADLGAFAAIRTKGLQPEITEIVDPCVGTIRRVESEADRQP